MMERGCLCTGMFCKVQNTILKLFAAIGLKTEDVSNEFWVSAVTCLRLTEFS